MGIPVIALNDIDRGDADDNILASIALQEAGLAHVLNAEGEKIQKILAMDDASVTQILDINDSVGSLISTAKDMEAALLAKLAIGYTGTVGATGAAGHDGVTGPDGESAYSLWLGQGNTGDAETFLASLIGPAGETGPTGASGTNGSTGITGPTGATGAAGVGASAYDTWIAAGNQGSTAEYLASLVGTTGAAGRRGADGPRGPEPERPQLTGIFYLMTGMVVATAGQAGSTTLYCQSSFSYNDATYGNYYPKAVTGIYFTSSGYARTGWGWDFSYINTSDTNQTINIYAICFGTDVSVN
jgi:hypothetical protein